MRRTFAVILLLLTLTGCERTARWQEHVQLSDGTVLVVDRAVHFERRGQIGLGSAWVPIDERLDFKDPASGISLEWQYLYRIAGVVDRVDGQFWVFARLTTNCLAGLCRAASMDGLRLGWSAVATGRSRRCARSYRA